jgi:hypothetical protein
VACPRSWHLRAAELGPVRASECGAGGEEFGGESGVPRVAKRMLGKKREEWELEEPRMCKDGVHAWKGTWAHERWGEAGCSQRAGSVGS